jgi:glycosyltransferase involved in cell wall biosynthesis
MRIGLMTTSFPRSESDIAGAFVLGFARALAAVGHRIEVLAPEPREQASLPQLHDIDVRHIAYLRPRALERTFYGAGVPDNLARDPLAWLGLAPFTCALTHAARSCATSWDAVFSHWALPCALAAAWSTARRIPHVAVLHSADVHLLGRLPARAWLAQHIAQGADALWFVSDEQRRRFSDMLPAHHKMPRTLVCPMGIDIPRSNGGDRRAIRHRHGLRGFCVLSLGRLVPIKGLDTLIRACGGTDITLLIAGQGPERSGLGQLAAAVRADVRFLGTVTGAAKTDLLHAVDAFALPSRRLPNGRSEGLPTTLLEALAHGLPVLASRLPGIEQLLDSTALARWLVPSDDPAQWRLMLEALRAAPPAQLPAADAARALVEPYAWPNVARRALQLLDRSGG